MANNCKHGAEKKCPLLELAAYKNVKIQSLYGSLINRGFH